VPVRCELRRAWARVGRWPLEPAGPSRLGAVATNDAYSDWSTQAFPPSSVRGVWLRIRRDGQDGIVDASPEGTCDFAPRRARLLVAGSCLRLRFELDCVSSDVWP
jgi:regulation of enolase protein 1 (concanavalin A-like superfamily)